MTRGSRRRLWIIVLPACAAALAACGAEKKEISTQTCTARLPATGSKHKVPDTPQTTCTVPVLWCNYCEYSADGQLLGNGSHPCGVCTSTDTK